MSVPLDFIPDDYLREALILTKTIDWDEAYLFTSIDRAVTPLIVEISTSVKKNSVQVNPNYQYGFDANEALHQSFRLDIHITANNQTSISLYVFSYMHQRTIDINRSYLPTGIYQAMSK